MSYRFRPMLVLSVIAVSVAIFGALGLGLGTVAASHWPLPNFTAAPKGGQLFYTTGTVTVRIGPAEAFFDSDLQLCDLPGGGPPLFIGTNRQHGTNVTIDPSSLGYNAGDELVFCILMTSGEPGNVYRMGPASRNPDSTVHNANVVSQTSPIVIVDVGFEDLFGGGDLDYDDNIFRFEGAIAPAPHDPLTIDIKPGSDPNSINTKGKGTIPVAILSTASFDATAEVDKTSLTFGHAGDENSLAKCTKSDEDVNGDGLLDVVCHFRTQATGFQVGDTEGMLSGETIGGTSVEGRDSVRIVQ